MRLILRQTRQVIGRCERRVRCRKITKSSSKDEWKVVDLAGILDLLARPEEVVARAHRSAVANAWIDSGRNGRLRPRAFHLQLVLAFVRFPLCGGRWSFILVVVA